MSSLRNAVKRITHKERAQPQARSHLGLLQKKKDYKIRAKDYHRKEDKIKALKEKAIMRNPDEFYFGMKNSHVVDGKHRKTQEAKQRNFDETVGHDTIRLLKDQDLAHIRMQKQKDRSKVSQLQASLHFLDQSNREKKHTIFVASAKQAEAFDTAEHFDTLPELANRSFNRIRNKQVETMVKQDPGADDRRRRPTKEQLVKEERLNRKQAKLLAKERSKQYQELQARQKRSNKLERAENHLVLKKNLAKKGRRRLVKAASNGHPAQYKWRRKRLA